MQWLIKFISTGFFIGERVPAPGTAASIVAAAIYYIFLPVESAFYWTMLILLTFIGVITAGKTEDIKGRIDPPEVVIDEIVGFLIAMAFIPKQLSYVILGLILFRFLDIAKLYPINKLQVVAGGLGIMLDDIYAGIVTNIVLRIIIAL
ncbi:MAG: phosphatidylglycerophosphatase A family protein [Elusimicrobiota bacterium]